MTTPIAQALVSITDTGRHGTARLAAVTALAEALGCRARCQDPLTGHRHRARSGDYYVTIRGPEPAVTWLQAALPGLIARLDQAAAAATREYASWLRNGCPADDHMPAERAGLRARWRREYLRAYGQALAVRIKTGAGPASGPAEPGELYRGHRAWRAAARDAGHARLAGYQPPPARRVASTDLLVAAGPAAEQAGDGRDLALPGTPAAARRRRQPAVTARPQ